VRARKGKYLPFVDIYGSSNIDNQSKYTRLGALDANSQIVSGQKTPTPLPNYSLGAQVSWQVDIWKQLRNAKKSAAYSYLSTVEGRNFMVTNLIADIAYAYYELMSLDNQLEILKANIQVQTNALNIITLEKTAGRVTEFAKTKVINIIFNNKL
jgi:outer membrane protein, multidrug efflux system